MGLRRSFLTFLDLLSTKETKRRRSEAKSTRNKEEEKQVKDSKGKRGTRQQAMIPNMIGPEVQANPQNHSSFDTDLEDEVFMRHASLPASRRFTMASGVEASRLSSSEHRASTRSLPVKTQQGPASDANTPSQKLVVNTLLQRSPSGSLSGSQSFMDEAATPAASCPPTIRQNRVFFPSDQETPQDSPETERSFTPRRWRNRTGSKSHIKVKYTKVYGEEDGAYKNDSVPRGIVFMCNFAKFQNNIYSERIGSEHDYDNLLNLFQQMGYGNRTRRNNKYCQTGYITKKDFMERLKAFSREKKHQVMCSCVIIIMSHGSGPKKFITSDNQEVDLMEVYSILDNINCEFLKNKPKLFILQFCRNNERGATGSVPRQPENPPADEDMLRRIVREEVARIFQTQRQEHGFNLKETDEGNPRSPRNLVIEELSRKASAASLSSASQTTNQPQCHQPNQPQCHQPNQPQCHQPNQPQCYQPNQPQCHQPNQPQCHQPNQPQCHQPNQPQCHQPNQPQCHQPNQLQCHQPNPGHHYEADTRHVPPQSPQEGLQRYSDMYSIFSTAPGELSHRDPRKGSLLIQAICHVFAENAYHDDIDTLVRKVSTYMTKTLQKNDPITVPRQTCERTNNGLDKLFYFNPHELPYSRHVTI